MKGAKYIFLTGEDESFLGNGIISSSIARLLQSRGFCVNIVKFSSLINVDRGSLNVGEYGECYITTDGHEVDMDLGNYERIANIKTSCVNYVSIGQIYQSVINKELRGEFCGKIIKIQPHVVDEIKRHITAEAVTAGRDFIIVDIGGTVDDIGVLPCVEVMRQLKQDQKCCCVNVQVDCDDEENEINIFIEDEVIHLTPISSKYELPLRLREQQIDEILLHRTNTNSVIRESDLTEWECFVNRMNEATREVKIGLIGKYADNTDAYRSIRESMLIAAVHNDCKLEISQVSSQLLNDGNVSDALKCFAGVIIAPGNGSEGVEGAIAALKWCRENDVPTLAIGQGMQCMIIEYARNVLGIFEANSTEAEPRTSHNVVDLMIEQKSLFGGVVRLGAYQCILQEGSKVEDAYGTLNINERYRNRYELNSDYREQLEVAGMKCVGINRETGLVDVIEVSNKRWFVGTLFHPEYNSSVLQPNPLFMNFLKTIIENIETEK